MKTKTKTKTKKADGKKSNERAVIVTTAHKGVFYGWASNTDGDTITLKRSRLCIYWPAECQGFMGLAAKGPLRGAKVGPRADIMLRDITAVLECTEEATKLWESTP